MATVSSSFASSFASSRARVRGTSAMRATGARATRVLRWVKKCPRRAVVSSSSSSSSWARRTRARVTTHVVSAEDAREGAEALARAMSACEGAGSAWDAKALERALRAPEAQRVFVCARDGSGEVVAYAYAASDGSMVATVERVCVREDLRRRGVGTRTARALGDALAAREIYDVGARVPGELRMFFEGMDYDDDESGATFMRWMPGEGAGT
jgi:GNAT superfamily N-acetyltransferase